MAITPLSLQLWVWGFLFSLKKIKIIHLDNWVRGVATFTDMFSNQSLSSRYLDYMANIMTCYVVQTIQEVCASALVSEVLVIY